MNFQELEKHLKFEFIIRVVIYILIGLCFILSLIAILTTDVSAAELRSTDVTNAIQNTNACGSYTNGSYCYQQSNVSYKGNVNTSYGYAIDGLAMRIENFSWNINSPTTIEIYNAANSFTTNVNYSCSFGGNNQPVNCTVERVNNGRININFKTGLGYPQVLYINLGYQQFIDGININKVILLQSVDDPNASVIENANQNTSDIINNANSNTQSIVDKVNEAFVQSVANGLQEINNTHQQLARMCKNIYSPQILKGKQISESDGVTLIDDPNSYYTDYFSIPTITIQGHANPQSFYIKEPTSSTRGYSIFWYTENRTLISYQRVSTRGLTIPTNAVWFRYSSLSPDTVISRYSSDCINADDLTLDYLKDDTDPSVNNNDINNVIGNVQVQDPLNYLLTLPLNLLTKLNTLISADTCSRVSFGNLYDTELYLPCIDFEDILGGSLWNTIDVIVGIGLLVIVIKRFYDSISNILTLGKEKEVRDKLDLPTPMEFLSMILGGGR